MPIRSFADHTTRDIFAGQNTKAARRIPQQAWKAAKRRLDAIHSAHKLSDLSLPGYGLEPLKYTKPGFYSIKVNDQYRVLFQFEGINADHVQIADYHGK